MSIPTEYYVKQGETLVELFRPDVVQRLKAGQVPDVLGIDPATHGLELPVFIFPETRFGRPVVTTN